MTRRENYVSTRPIGFQGSKHVLFNITIVIRSVLLKHEVEPALKSLVLAFALALCVAIFLGAVLPNVIIDPLQRVSQSIDLIRTGQFGAVHCSGPARSSRVRRRALQTEPAGRAIPGRQAGRQRAAHQHRAVARNAWKKACLLFDDTGRLLMAGEPAERMLGKTRDEMVGRAVDELFPPSSVLGEIIGNAVRNRESIDGT